jgi:hypothetical protein
MRGFVDQTWEFEASGSTTPPHVFQMEPIGAALGPSTVRTRPVPTSAWVTGGLTLSLAAAGGVLGALAVVKHRDFDAENNGMNPQTAQNDKNLGQTLNIATDAAFGTAIAGAIVTAVLFAQRPTVERPLTVQTSLLPSAVAPLWSPQGGGMSAAWIF